VTGYILHNIVIWEWEVVAVVTVVTVVTVVAVALVQSGGLSLLRPLTHHQVEIERHIRDLKRGMNP